MNKIYNILEGAEYLGVSLREIQELTNAGLIKFEELNDGNSIGYEEIELEKTKQALYKRRDRI